MTKEEARQNVGRKVWYSPGYSREREGVLTFAGDSLFTVQFTMNSIPESVDPNNLNLFPITNTGVRCNYR